MWDFNICQGSGKRITTLWPLYFAVIYEQDIKLKICILTNFDVLIHNLI